MVFWPITTDRVIGYGVVINFFTNFCHLRRIHAICRQLGCDVTVRLVTALVLLHLGYCNAVLAGLPASTLAPFQRVLHAVACTVLDLRLHDCVTPALQELHWLPVTVRIQLKLCLMIHDGPFSRTTRVQITEQLLLSPTKQDPSSDHTGEDPSKDRNGNYR